MAGPLMNLRLLAIGVWLRAREVWDRFSAWLLEPAERREHDRWQQERHAATLAELKPMPPYPPYHKASGMFIAVAPPGGMPTEVVEPWHGKASGCA